GAAARRIAPGGFFTCHSGRWRMVATMSMTVVWLLCMGVPLALGLWAQRKVKRTFARWSEVPVRNGMTGAQAAAAVIRASGLPDVEIRAAEGRLSDHYDPRSRTLNLSPDVGGASTVAALGVA